MRLFINAARKILFGHVLAAIGLLVLPAQQGPNTLKIGTVGPLVSGGSAEAADNSLKDFVKLETKLTTEVVHYDNWQQLADELSKKNVQIGIFRGMEYAWAHQRRASIKPIVLAVTGPRYPVIYLVSAKSSAAKSVAEMKDQSAAIPEGSEYLRPFLERAVLLTGQPAEKLFARITTPNTPEDALDDVVDNVVAVAVVDRASLDTYKRRKAGRFAKLKELMHSAAFLPPTIAFVDGGLNETTRQQFQNGLIAANKKDRGQTLLSVFKLDGFEAAPPDFDAVTMETLRVFPPPKARQQEETPRKE